MYSMMIFFWSCRLSCSCMGFVLPISSPYPAPATSGSGESEYKKNVHSLSL